LYFMNFACANCMVGMALSTSCVVDPQNDILHLPIKSKNSKVTACAPRWPAENTPCIGVRTGDEVDETVFFKTLQCLSRFFLKHRTSPHYGSWICTIDTGNVLSAGIG